MSVDQNVHNLHAYEPGCSTLQSAEKRYKLTAEEYRTLQECNRESFFYRSLPFAAAGMVAVHLATKRGLLTSHPRWGSTWKMLGAGFLGWFIGKVSYQGKCAEKLMQLPNSQLAEALRRNRSGEQRQQFNPVEQYPTQLEQHSDTSESEAIPLSQEPVARDLFPQKDVSPSGLEDRFRPSVDNPQILEQPVEEPPPQVYTTYDELRRKNRESAPPPSGSSYPVYRSPSSPSPPRLHREKEPSESRGGSKNLYGDVWDD